VRILAVTTSFPRFAGDSCGRFVFDLHAGLKAEGHEVLTICPAADDAPLREEGEAGSVLRVPYAPAGRQDLFYGSGLEARWKVTRSAGWKLALFLWRARRQLACEARRADLLIGHWLWPGARLALRASGGRPVLGIAHGGDVHLLASGLRGRLLCLGLRKGLRGVLATSRAGAELARRRLGVPPSRIRVRPMGVDLRRFREPGPSPFEGLGDYLLAVGRLVPIKGYDLLVRAAAGLDLPLVIAGEGPEREALLALARSVGCRLHLPGRLPPSAVAAAMGGALAVVVPSRVLPSGRAEGCPVAAVEALAAGARLLAARTGGLMDLLPPESLFEPGDLEDLLRRLRDVLSAPPAPPPVRGLDRRDAARDLLRLLAAE